MARASLRHTHHNPWHETRGRRLHEVESARVHDHGSRQRSGCSRNTLRPCLNGGRTTQCQSLGHSLVSQNQPHRTDQLQRKDPLNANVEAWADYWASAKVDAVALSVSGLIAFYPTDVPYFRRSRWLNGRDLFGECVKAAKARGLRVYARMSPDIQPIDDEILRVRPLTYRRNASGGLQSQAPGVANTCQFSTHYSEQQPAIIRELNARYDIDGLYMNGWPGQQNCYCETCRKIGDPRSKAYREAVLKSAVELVEPLQKARHREEPQQLL